MLWAYWITGAKSTPVCFINAGSGCGVQGEGRPDGRSGRMKAQTVAAADYCSIKVSKEKSVYLDYL